MLLTDFNALTFDCYGTLIDWETGMVEALKSLSDRVKRPLTRDQILEAHARHESSQQRYTPAKRYRELLPIVYKRLAEEWGVHVTHEDCVEYGRSVGNWPAFRGHCWRAPVSQEVFQARHLSNVDNESFRASNRRLQVEFDAIYTAEDIGSYKPSARNFDYMIEKMGEIRSAQGEDPAYGRKHVSRSQAGKRYGLKSCWIYRRHDQQGFGATINPGQMPHFDFRFTSMHELVKSHQEQLLVK